MNVSLIIPSYNSAHYLKDCLQSALMQREASFSEIIVVDDASQDSPEEVIAEFDQEITLIKHEENKRVGEARNTGARHATGEFLVFLDTDDILAPNYLVKMEQFITSNELVCAGCWLYYMTNPGNKGKVIKVYPTIDQAARYPGTFPSGFMIQRKLFEQYNGFTSKIINSEDSEFFSRLYKSGIPIFNLAEPLVGYRISPTSKTSASKERKMFFKELLFLVYQKDLDIPLESFHNIYNMRSQGLPCPEKFEKNQEFIAIYNRKYPWRELIRLRSIYALWLDRRHLQSFLGVLRFAVTFPTYTVRMIISRLQSK